MRACSKCYCTKLGNELTDRHGQWISHYMVIFFMRRFTDRLAVIDVQTRIQQAIKTSPLCNWPKLAMNKITRSCMIDCHQ